MQAFADDVEGRQANIDFGPGPTSSSNSGASSSASRSSSSSSSPSGRVPELDPSHEENLGDKVANALGGAAHALGGALGWAERKFGRGRKDDKKD